MDKAKKRNNPKNKPAPVVAKKPAASSSAASSSSAAAASSSSAAASRQHESRGRPRGPKKEASTGPVFVGGPKNEHGTRVVRRVTCGRCGSADHVPYVPKDLSRALCRKCAAEILKTFEQGTRAPVQTRPAVCNLCGTPFQMPVRVQDDGDPLCRSCLRGFTSWQGSVDVPFAERAEVVVEERLAGTLVRRKKQDAPHKPDKPDKQDKQDKQQDKQEPKA